MFHLPAGPARPGRAVAFLAAAMLLSATIAGCSGSSDSASTTSTTSADRGGTEALATACSEVDLAPVEQNAADLNQDQLTLKAAAGKDAEFTAATVAFLGTGTAFFASLAAALDPVFASLAQASGQSAVADVTNDFESAADDFSALAPAIESAGTVTPDDIAKIQAVNATFDTFGEYVNPGSTTGDELWQIPACKTLLQNLDAATSAISAADGKDELETEN